MDQSLLWLDLVLGLVLGRVLGFAVDLVLGLVNLVSVSWFMLKSVSG